MLAGSQLLAAREQMAISLGFHIILSCFGVAFPVAIYIVHRRAIVHDDHDALILAKRWSKAAAVLFAVGAVSGTILSFEMGLLWPGLMSRYGSVIGLPFAVEGIAFFVEAIFIGIYLYGWGRLPARTHLRTLWPIMISGVVGTFCILSVNAWMNAPSGFRLEGEGDAQRVVDVDLLGAVFNRALWPTFFHLLVATYLVVGFAVAAVYASGMLRGRRDRLHRLGLSVALRIGALAAIVQPFIGHIAGMRLATDQPSKLAAMELAVETRTRAPLTLGGLLIDGKVWGGIEIPWLGSLLARGGIDRPVPGLADIPGADRPPVNITHLSFQAMVGMGTLLALFAAVFLFCSWRKRDLFTSRRFLRATVVSGVLAVATLEAGWITTEVGRQPWIAYRLMRVEDAVTSNSGIWISLIAIVVVYTAMTVGAVLVLRSMSRRWREGDPAELPTPYSPS